MSDRLDALREQAVELEKKCKELGARGDFEGAKKHSADLELLRANILALEQKEKQKEKESGEW